jgi:hypothetical protein
LLETYGPGKPEEADGKTMDEDIMVVTNDIFEEEQENVVGEEEKEDVDGEEEQEDDDDEEEQEDDDDEEQQEDDGAEVKDAAMVMQAFGITSLVGHGKFQCFFL